MMFLYSGTNELNREYMERYINPTEFVEAQKLGLVCESCRNNGNRIAVKARSCVADAIMHAGHELMEMHAPLRSKARILVKQVHQHGLAATDGAVNVDAARRAGRAPEEARYEAGFGLQGRKFTLQCL